MEKVQWKLINNYYWYMYIYYYTLPLGERCLPPLPRPLPPPLPPLPPREFERPSKEDVVEPNLLFGDL